MSRAYFDKMVKGCIHRDGINDLMAWLSGTDFYDAPASTKYHLNRKGGLVDHSCHVFDRLESLCVAESCANEHFQWDIESAAIVGLFHDLCKVNYYTLEMRDKKIDGKWQKVPLYEIREGFPLGHGEKSLYIVSGFLKLKEEEALAIRWHMGPWMEKDFRTMQLAMQKYPLVVLTQTADLMATYIDEEGTNEAR